MKVVSLTASVLVMCIGVLVLTGWVLDIEMLKSVAPNLVTMKANTAIGFLLSGMGVCLLSWREPGKGVRNLVRAIAGVVALIGALTLSEYFFGWNLGIDQLFFHEAPNIVWTSHPGRMAPVTAFCFMLIAGGLVAATQPAVQRQPILAGIGTAVTVMGGLALAGCVADAWLHAPAWNDSGLALHTALAFLLLGCAFLELAGREQRLRWALDSLVTFGFVVALVIMLLAAGVSYDFTNQLFQTAHSVSHRQEVLKETENAAAGMATLESAQRGYAIVGDEGLLTNVEQTKEGIQAALANLRKLTADNPAQQRRLDELEPLIAQRIALGGKTIDVRRKEGFAAAQGMIASGAGTKLSTAINRLVKEMQETEYGLLDQDQQRSRTAAMSTFLVLPLGVFLSLTISSLGLFFLNAGVGERIRMEAALRASEMQLGSVVEQAPVAIAMLDRNMVYLATSRRWVNEHGEGHGDLTGKCHYDIHPDLPDSWKESHRLALAGTAQHREEELWVRADGAGRWLRRMVQPWQDAHGAIGGIIIVTEDVTDRRHAEQFRLENVRLEEENRRVAEANRLKSEFLANMSHELRTPLNGIIGFSELLFDERPGPLNRKQKEYLGDVLNSANHLLQLINDVLDLAKVEAGKFDFQPEAFLPGRAIEEVCAVVRGLANKKGIHLKSGSAPELGPVVLDQHRFKQVCYNLLSNAVKFTDAGGNVEIYASVHDAGSFEVRVSDTGIGIKEEDMERLFREFEQLESGAARRFQGTGLGLAITRKLVVIQGGSISARSEYGKGSTFTVHLPMQARETAVT